MKKVFYYTVCFSILLSISCKKKKDDPEKVAPTACFSTEKEYYPRVQGIKFTNCSQNVQRCEWDFGDGQTSKDLNPTHSYYDAGAYDVRLKTFNGIYSEETTKRIQVGGLLRINYTINWDSTILESNGVIRVYFYYRKDGDSTFTPTRSGSPNNYNYNNLFNKDNHNAKQYDFIGVQNPTSSTVLKIIFVSFTGSGEIRDTILTPEFSFVHGPLKPRLSNNLKMGKFNHHYTLTMD